VEPPAELLHEERPPRPGVDVVKLKSASNMIAKCTNSISFSNRGARRCADADREGDGPPAPLELLADLLGELAEVLCLQARRRTCRARCVAKCLRVEGHRR